MTHPPTYPSIQPSTYPNKKVGGLVPLLMALYLFSSGAALTAARRPTAEYTVGGCV